MARPPKTFNDFIGQPRVIRHLARKIAGAKELGRACPSILLAGPSGIGKTTLAEAVAREYGTNILKLFAGEDTTPLEICRNEQEPPLDDARANLVGSFLREGREEYVLGK